jgi:indolepyruvate ferredoxin oxidoreductase beta subunit
VIGAETHGMAQRGGSVISHLRIGDAEGSLVQAGSAHYLLSLDETEGYRCLGFLSRGGRMVVNSNTGRFPVPEVKGFLDDNDILYRSLPAGKIAMEMGAPLSANLALLGFFAAVEGRPFSAGDLLETVERISPERFRKTNIDVFNAGARLLESKE